MTIKLKPALLPLFIALAARAEEVQLEERAEQVRLEEIVVPSNSYTSPSSSSATGLNLKAKDTPQSLSTLTAARWRDQGLSTVEGAMKQMPGVQVENRNGTMRLRSRGYAMEQIAEDGVSTTVGTGTGGDVVGGMPTNNPRRSYDLSLYDKIEVVRGAAGLLQGNSAPGGMVNLVRKKPKNTPGLQTELLLDRFGRARAVFDGNGHWQGWRGRSVLALDNGKTFQKRKTGADFSLYGVIDHGIGDDGLITLGSYYLRQRNQPDLNGLPLPAQHRWSRREYLGADWSRIKSDKGVVFAEYEQPLNDRWRLNSKAEYRRENSHDSYSHLDGSDKLTFPQMNAEGPYKNDRHSDQLSLGLDLNGSYELLGRDHDFYGSYSYSRERNRNFYKSLSDANSYNALSYQIPRPDWSEALRSGRLERNEFYEGDYKTHALVLGSRFNARDDLHFIVGGRFSHWQQGSGGWDYKKNAFIYAPAIAGRRVHSEKRFMPYAAVSYDLNDQQSLYASYASISKPQKGYLDINDRPLPPAIGSNYEVGWKGSFNDERLNASAALYRTDQRDLMANIKGADGKMVQTKNGVRWARTVNDVRSEGVDLEISGDIDEKTKIGTGYGWNRNRYRKTANTFNAEGQVFSSDTPRHLFRAYGSYRFAPEWTLGLGLNAQSRTNRNTASAQGGYALWSASLAYQPTKRFQVSLIGSNLGDKRYFTRKSGSAHWGNFYGEPRNVQLQLRYDLE